MFDGFSPVIDNLISELTQVRRHVTRGWRGKWLVARCETSNMASSSDTALKTFSLTNDIKQISPQDEIYKYDPERVSPLL